MTNPADTLGIALPVGQAFPGSILEMPLEAAAYTSAAAVTPTAWWWNVLIIIATAAMLACVPNLRFLSPRLLDCIWRWRGNFILETSIPNQNARNTLAITMLLPFGMMVYRFSLVDFRWLGAFLLIRLAMYGALSSSAGKHRSEYHHAHICLHNYFIILVFLMLVSISILTLFTDAPDRCVRTVLLVEVWMMYLLHFVRKMQILRSAFPALQVFLYLCALEIVPSGLLITATVLL